MPTLDPFQPLFSQRDVTECTGIGKGTIDSYIINDHLRPYMIGGRRAFSAVQMIELAIIHRLAGAYKIPPSLGASLARQLVAGAPENMLLADARDAQSGVSWIGRASYRGQVCKDPGIIGDGIDLVVPVQLVARMIFAKAAEILALAGEHVNRAPPAALETVPETVPARKRRRVKVDA